MILQVLGSGTVTPHLDRAGSGYRVTADSNQNLGIDLGPGCLRRALEHELEPWKWEDLVFSHVHPDHTADLVPYLFARNYATPPWSQGGKLKLWGPPGFVKFFEDLCRPWPWLEGTHFELEVVEYAGPFNLGSLNIEPFAVEHAELSAYAFRITESGRVFTFSGDTRLCQGLRRAAQGAHLFLCECSIPAGFPMKGDHMVSDQIGPLARECGVERILLTHIYPLPETIDLVAEVGFEGPCELARDGQRYPV